MTVPNITPEAIAAEVRRWETVAAEAEAAIVRHTQAAEDARARKLRAVEYRDAWRAVARIHTREAPALAPGEGTPAELAAFAVVTRRPL